MPPGRTEVPRSCQDVVLHFIILPRFTQSSRGEVAISLESTCIDSSGRSMVTQVETCGGLNSCLEKK